MITPNYPIYDALGRQVIAIELYATTAAVVLDLTTGRCETARLPMSMSAHGASARSASAPDILGTERGATDETAHTIKVLRIATKLHRALVRHGPVFRRGDVHRSLSSRDRKDPSAVAEAIDHLVEWGIASLDPTTGKLTLIDEDR